MADIFFSYASAERELVAPLAHALGRHGWTVWWDRQIPPGRTFDEVIEEALEGAKAVVCVWTEQGAASGWVRTEAAEGAARYILVPVLMEDVTIPLAFRRIQAADLTDWEEGQEHDGFKELLAALERVIDRSSETVPTMVPEPEDPLKSAVVAAQTRLAEKDWEAVVALLEPLAATDLGSDEEQQEVAELLQLARGKRDAAELYEEAEVLYADGRWQQVVLRLDRILELDPDFEIGTDLKARAERHIHDDHQRKLSHDYQRALEALEVRDWVVAIARFEQLLSEDPEYADAAVRLEHARAALEFDRQYRAVRDDFHQGEWDRVVAAMSELVEGNPDFGDPDDLLAKAQARITQAKTRRSGVEVVGDKRSATGPTPRTPAVPLRPADRPPRPQPREEPSRRDMGSDREPSGSIAAGIEGTNRFFRDRRWMALTGGALVALIVVVALISGGDDPSPNAATTDPSPNAATTEPSLGAPTIGSLGCSSIAEIDEPVRCSPAVSNTSGTTVYEWTAADGSPRSGSASTFETSFGSPGTWTIGLSACNGARCDNMSASVNVSLPPSAWGSTPSWHLIANSHQPAAWCPAGSFIVAFDIDEVPSWNAQDSPAMSRAFCAILSGASSSAWQEPPVSVTVGALNSHGQGGDWCEEGMYLVGLDQDRGGGGDGDEPIVGSALCGGPSGSPYTSSEKSWHTVGFTESMTPSGPWCPEGTFMTRFDLDGGADGHLYPIVARVECGRPAQ